MSARVIVGGLLLSGLLLGLGLDQKPKAPPVVPLSAVAYVACGELVTQVVSYSDGSVRMFSNPMQPFKDRTRFEKATPDPALMRERAELNGLLLRIEPSHLAMLEVKGRTLCGVPL